MVSGDAGTDPVSGDLTREEIAEGLAKALVDAGRLVRRIEDGTGDHWAMDTALLAGIEIERAAEFLAAASRDLASRSEERPGLTEENRALRELVEWTLRMIDGHAADLDGLRESVSEQATKIALDRLASRDRQAEGLSEARCDCACHDEWAVPRDQACEICGPSHPPPAPTPVLREEAGE